MKKILSILFSFIFIFNLAGYYFVFLGMQHQTREMMRLKIKQNYSLNNFEMVKISLKENPSIVETIENSEEFEYNGNLYDVAKTEIVDGFLFIYCMNDKDEETLLANLGTHIKNNITPNSPSNKDNKDIVKNIVKDYFSKNNILNFFKIETSTIFSDYQFFDSSLFSRVSTPPPRIV